MKKLFENWNNYLNERGNPNEQRFRQAVVTFVIEQMKTMSMNPGDPNDRKRIQKDTRGIVDLAIEQLGLAQEGNLVNDSELAEADAFSDRLSLSTTIRDEIIKFMEDQGFYEMGAIPPSVIKSVEKTSLRIADAVKGMD